VFAFANFLPCFVFGILRPNKNLLGPTVSNTKKLENFSFDVFDDIGLIDYVVFYCSIDNEEQTIVLCC